MCGTPYTTNYALRGKEQLAHYLRNRQSKFGYLVVFDGRKSAKAKVKVMDKDFKHNNCKVSLTIIEGRNHQVKKMFAAVGLHVRKLHRANYGHLNLNGLVPGQYRKLKYNEIQELLELAEFGYLDY